MSKILDNLIAQVRDDDDAPAGLLEGLLKIRAELGADATDDEAQEAIAKFLAGHMAGGRDAEEDDDDDDEEEKIVLSREDAVYMEETKVLVRELFDEEGWHYSEKPLRPDLYVFEMGFGLKNCNLRMKVYVEADPRVCRVDAILPITADKTYDWLLGVKLASANYPKRYGAFQYDERDGEVSYRYSFPTTHGLHKDDLKSVFLAVATSADREYDAIKKCCVGRFKNKEINEILKKVNELVDDLSDDEE